jgi:hypothetical protein
MLLSALAAVFGMRPGRALPAELRRIGFTIPSGTTARSRRQHRAANVPLFVQVSNH